MAVDLGTAYISIVPTTKDIQGDITKALRGLDKVGAKAGGDLGTALGKSAEKSFNGSSLGSKLSSGLSKSLKAGAIGAGAAVAGAFGTALVKGFGRLQAIDQAEAKFRGLGKSAQEIEGIMSDVTASVKGTAFSTADAADVAAMALAAGAKPGDELQRTLKLVGDSAAFAGRGFGELGPVFTEAMSMGKVTGETLAQMRDNSIPAIAALSEHLGVSTAEVQKMASQGKISFEDFATSMETYIGGQALASGDTFQGSLNNMGAAMGRFGEKLLAPVFANAPAVFTAVGGAFDELGTKLEPVIASFSEWLAPQMENLAQNVIPAVLDGVLGFIDGLISMGEWISNNSEWLGTVVSGLAGMVGALYLVENGAGLVAGALKHAKDAVGLFSNGLKLLVGHPVIAAIGLIVGALVYFFTQTETGRQMWARFTEFLGNAWNSCVTWIKTKITEMVAKFFEWRANISNAINVVKGVFERFKNAAVDAASRVIDGFTQIPGKIKNAFANAGSWLLDAGKNIIRGLADGISAMTGAVADALRAVIPDNLERFVPGLHFGGLAGFARGGVLPRVPGIPDSVRDPILGVNGQGIPVARVESGEFIVNREATKKHLPLLRAINGGGLDPAQGDLGLPRYADGGLVTFDEVVKFLKGGTVNGNPTPAPLEGYPYTWGGGLDGNWGDCSGLQSAIAALVAGVDTTGRKFATMTQGAWLAQHGFKRGRSPGKNAYESAYFNGGNFGGHTAGTIFDSKGRSINVEMGGGRGNGQFGGPAAGSRDGQFTDIWWRELKPMGEAASAIAAGAIKSTSVDGVTIEGTDGKTYSVDWGAADSLASAWESGSERERKLDEWEKRFGSFDQGGVLAGKGVFAKNTLSPERVLSPSQTKAFDELPKALYAQAASIDGLTSRLEWQKVGAEMAEGLEAKGRFGRSMLASVGRGDTLRAYAAGLSLDEGVGLADRVGKIFGMEKIGSTLNPVVEAWTDMEDAAIGQVDAADAIKQAEKNLADARKDGDKEAIKAAESELEKATGVAKSAAAAVGQAQVAMALTVVETIVGLVEGLATWINDKIQSVFEGQQSFWSAIESSVKSIGDVAKLVEDLRSDVIGLALDYGDAMIELRAANRDVRLAALDAGRAQLEAVVSVAEAQAAFDAQRLADMRLAAQAYDDLSLVYDRFRWNQMTSTELAMDLNAQWSDESHALFAELMSAQIGLDIARAEGEKAALEATLKQTLAALDMQKVSDSLSVAAQKLAVASGQAFGVSQAEATVAQRYATLAEERARLKAEIADSENWLLNAGSYWGEQGLKATNERRIAEIDAMLEQIQAMPEAQTQITAEMQKQAEFLFDKAGWWGFIGNSAQIGKLAETGALGAGARALDEIEFQTTLIDLKASDDALRLSIEEGLAQISAQPAIDAADLKIQALELARDSEDTWAEYWRSEDERVREALADLGRAQSDNAATIRDMSARAAQPVTLVGNNFDADGVQVLLEKLGHRVDRLESPVSTGADVLMSRR